MPPPYFLGDHPAELARLEFQARAWRDISVGLCREAGVGPNTSVVDLGCGPGSFTIELASMVGAGGRVLAVDRSEEFLAALETRVSTESVAQVSVMCHDIEQDSLPGGGFDVVFTRWLHPYVRDLSAVLTRELECLRPGGKTISIGTFNYQGVGMCPRSDDFDFVTKRIIEYYEINGLDISAEGVVPALLSAQGATIVAITNVAPLARFRDDLWEWYRQFSFSMLPRLLDAGLIDRARLEAYAAVWEERSRLPGAFIGVPPHVAIIAQKPLTAGRSVRTRSPR